VEGWQGWKSVGLPTVKFWCHCIKSISDNTSLSCNIQEYVYLHITLILFIKSSDFFQYLTYQILLKHSNQLFTTSVILLLLPPFYGPLSRTTQTRMSWYQKKHSPTHLSWSSSNLYQVLPSTTIHSTLPVQFTCLTIFLHNLSPSPLWSTSWSGALHLKLHSIHFFTESVPYFL